MAEIVKITCGQPFVVYLPLVILNADGSKEAVDASRLTDVAVKLQAQGVDDVMVTTEAYEQYLVLNIPGTMPVAEYNIIVNATLPNSRPFTLRMSRALGVMAWDWQTNWRDYLVGEHIELCDQPFIAGEFTTDAEYEALKQQLREQIAAAEQAEEEAIAEKEQYAEALEHLDDIAQETSVEGIADSIGVPATGQPGTLFAAIAAGGGGGGGGDAQESTSQAILAAVQSGNVTAIAELLNNAHGLDALRALIAAIPTTAPATPQNVTDAKDAIIAALPSVSGLATEANATVNKQAVLNALTAAEAALQGGDQTATLTALKQAVAAIVIPTDYAKETTAQAAATDAAAAKTAAQAITGYALQGSDATATNTAILEEVQQITSLDADLLAGKRALAASISSKGVPSSVSEALTVMATKVLQIPQQLNTGISEFEQMIAPSPYMWNVYTVATDLMKNTLPSYIPSYMSGGTYEQYRANNAFFVGEYYRGHVSLELTGADGYLTHDGCFYTMANGVVTRTAPDGTVTTYEAESIVHTWINDPTDTYSNRWVAFFYLSNAYSFLNSNANICPRRVAICGNCLSFVISGENRLASVWVVGSLGHFEGGATGSAWDTIQTICNYREHTSGVIFANRWLTFVNLPHLELLSGRIFSAAPDGRSYSYGSQYISLPSLRTLTAQALIVCGTGVGDMTPEIIWMPKLTTLNVPIIVGQGQPTNAISQTKAVYLDAIEEINITSSGGGYSPARGAISVYNNCAYAFETIYCPNLKRIAAGYLIHKYGSYSNNFNNLIDVEVGAMETSLDLRAWAAGTVIADAIKLATLVGNIRNHILAKVSDRTGLSQLTFTVSTALYNAVSGTSIEWQGQTTTLADAFLTKNWLLAGA